MTMEMRLNDERYRGKQEGIAEGREELIRSSAPALLQAGMTMEQIAKAFQITADELQKILKA